MLTASAQQMTQEAAVTASDIVDRLEKTEARRQQKSQHYAMNRHYYLKNTRFDREAEMKVMVQVSRDYGKNFAVLSSTGSESIHNKVFQKLLAGEAELSRRADQSEGYFTKENYDFELLGFERINDRQAWVLALKPKRASKNLITGKAWVDSEDMQVVRIEGRPAANLSFWVGKPHIIIEYQKVQNLWMTSRVRSSARTKLTGDTELTIHFSNYQMGNSLARVAALVPLQTATLVH